MLEEQILDRQQKKLINDFMNSIDINYKSSYNLLMQVLEQIESLGYRWEIGMSSTSFYHYCKIWSIGKFEGISSADAIYGALVEFVTWYNQFINDEGGVVEFNLNNNK